MIEDSSSGTTMMVLNDHAQGGSAYVEGRIELAIARRYFTNDHLGLGEQLDYSSGRAKMQRFRQTYKLSFQGTRSKAIDMLN